MYKFLSILLAILVFIVSGFYCYERYCHAKETKKLNNQIADLSEMVQETENAYSRLGLVVDDINLKNKKLQSILNDRDEQIVSLSEVVLKWKGKYLEILDAQEDVVDNNGNVVDLDEKCKLCLIDKRFKVAFDKQEDYLRVFGETYTNPPEAFINIEWTKGITLSVVLAKKDDNYRVYIDSDNSDMIPAELQLKVDPSVYDIRWYERIGIGSLIAVGDGLTTSLGIYLQLFDNWIVGPMVVDQFNGKDNSVFYGGQVIWFPFR